VIYEYECECGRVTEEVRRYEDRTRPAVCGSCAKPARYRLSFASTPVIGKGRSESSQREWAAKEKSRLTKRAKDHDKSSAGRAKRAEAIARQFGVK
jgi:hypothetical protein